MKTHSGEDRITREALERRITAYLRAHERPAIALYSRHLRSFVWAPRLLELELEGERASHAELERRLRARLAASFAGSVASGEVWERGGRTRASHTSVPDPDALRTALEAALPGLAIELDDRGEAR